MFITIVSDTEPTTRPDGSPLQEADKWINGEVTKVWQIICYYDRDVLQNVDSSDPAFEEVKFLPGQWVVEGQQAVAEINGVKIVSEPLPLFDESDFV